MALITVRASLSSITRESCNSLARRRPCSTANTSTSSAGKWESRDLQQAATVCPLQSLMIIPMLEESSSSEADPSTLILKTPGGGGDQLCRWEDLGEQNSEDAATLKSSIRWTAICQTWEGEERDSSWITLFLLNQIAHATARKSFRSLEGKLERRYIYKIINYYSLIDYDWGESNMVQLDEDWLEFILYYIFYFLFLSCTRKLRTTPTCL